MGWTSPNETGLARDRVVVDVDVGDVKRGELALPNSRADCEGGEPLLGVLPRVRVLKALPGREQACLLIAHRGRGTTRPGSPPPRLAPARVVPPVLNECLSMEWFRTVPTLPS